MLTEQQKAKLAKVDSFLGKIVSRKLLVWFVATTIFILPLILGKEPVLTGENWLDLSLVYIGGQAAIDGLAQLIRARNS